MTLDQRKISLIHWITNIEDETVISKIEGYRKNTLDELPKEIIELLEMAASEPIENCIEHTNARDILNRAK